MGELVVCQDGGPPSSFTLCEGLISPLAGYGGRGSSAYDHFDL